jgi:ribosomal protein S18 acetylase RimI-like enzyme
MGMKIIKAKKTDKDRVVELLSLSFKENLSVAYLTGSGNDAALRVRKLMAYAFEVCLRFGVVWMTEKKDACALVLYPHLKGFSLYGIWLDLKLVGGVIGMFRLSRLMKRERLINAWHPDTAFAYLWFIGVNPWVQGRGVGSELLAAVLAESASLGLPVYLETSTLKNVPWYEKRGFTVFHEMDLGYRLFLLKKEVGS